MYSIIPVLPKRILPERLAKRRSTIFPRLVMPSHEWDPLSDNTYEHGLELTDYANHGSLDIDSAHHDGNHADIQQRSLPLVDMVPAASSGSLEVDHASKDNPPLGIPATKKRFRARDTIVGAISLFSLAMAVLSVANESVSWHLGVGNDQLIVVGFLMSIMSLCLNTVAPNLFLLLEAKFGSSTVQNYDGIIRNKPLASRLSFTWRLVIVSMLALPVGLSVAYKKFAGGSSALKIDSTSYISNTTYYGIFVPPGLAATSNGQGVGISLFFNATLPFREASSPSKSTNYSDPPLPPFPYASGYNVLMINETSTAVLDTMDPAYLLAAQQLLAIGESWTITAPVIGTVATLNNSKVENETEYATSYIEACTNTSAWTYGFAYLWNEWGISLLNRMSGPSDQSVQYIGIAPSGIYGIADSDSNCTQLPPYTYQFNIYRQPCIGTWSLTRGGFQLLEGFCNDTILPAIQQSMITYSQENLQQWYMAPLEDMLITFAGGSRGNQSVWMVPSIATSVAAMLWSRTALLQSVGLPDLTNPSEFNMSMVAETLADGTKVTYEELRILYPVTQNSQTILYNRPTLKKSYWLYVVFVIQPVMIMISIGLNAMLYTTPLGNGFGLVSILSGIDRQSLDSLTGASLSGEVAQPLKLLITPIHQGRHGVVRYQVTASTVVGRRNGKLHQKVSYH